MSDDQSIDDLDAAIANVFGKGDASEITDASKRRKREKRMALSPDDGRRKRATGRTKQFNVNMKPELHKQIVQRSRRHGISITVMVERAMAALIAELDREATHG